MINVTRCKYIENTTPAEIFAALADPNELTKLLPRVKKVETLERHAHTVKLATYVTLGGVFGTICCEGDLHWNEPSAIVFDVRTPLPVSVHWNLTPAVNGTEIEAKLSLNLVPMLGPMAAFVPVDAVAAMIAQELESALKSIDELCAGTGLQELAAAA